MQSQLTIEKYKTIQIRNQFFNNMVLKVYGCNMMHALTCAVVTQLLPPDADFDNNISSSQEQANPSSDKNILHFWKEKKTSGITWQYENKIQYGDISLGKASSSSSLLTCACVCGFV